MGLPIELRVCPCGQGDIESLQDMLFYCIWYKDIHLSYLNTFLSSHSGWDDLTKIQHLLSGTIKEITLTAASCFYAIMQRQRSVLRRMMSPKYASGCSLPPVSR